LIPVSGRWVTFDAFSPLADESATHDVLQQAVDRMVAIIQEDPHKERIDRVVTRWLKRHLHRLGAAVNLDQLDSLVEDKAMLAENLENLVRKERQERASGRPPGRSAEDSVQTGPP